MQTSGVVLDVYDDVGGEVLKTMFSSREEIPGFVKAAHALSAGEHAKLPDDAYALVLINGSEKLRKFACVDEGNTTLSVLYFIKHAHKLPAVARQRAAENLKVACGWYGLDVPVELEKEAGIVSSVAGGAANMAVGHAVKNPVGTALTLATAPSLIRGTRDSIKGNLAQVREGEAAHGGAEGGLHAAHHFLKKRAEVVGTSTMPTSVDSGKKPEVPLTTVRKTAHLRPVVDVTHEEPIKESTVKQASRYALGNRYPLDTHEQVKMASEYFSGYGRKFQPADRHTFCTNLVKRASELDIPVADVVRKYGSEKYASGAELRAAIDTRRQITDHIDKTASALLEEIFTAQGSIPPEDYVTLLTEFDKTAGLDAFYDKDVMDPYYSTYGAEKVAEDKEFRDTVDNFHVTGEDLKRLALTPNNLRACFSDDFVDEYCKDPVAIYKSMPRPQQKLIIRMATENSPG